MRFRRYFVCFVALISVALGLATSPSSGALDDLLLISRVGEFGDVGDALSNYADVSEDGRFVAFQGPAKNFSAVDQDGFYDVFLRDVQAGTTTLVSRSNDPLAMNPPGHSQFPAVSASGRYVAFMSEIAFDALDTNGLIDVYVRDLVQGVTMLASRENGATGPVGDGESGFPELVQTGVAISDNGRFVAFASRSTNLGADADVKADVFIRDLQTDTTTLVSRADGVAGVPGDAASTAARISGDGRYVAFYSRATNLHGDDLDTVRDVYVRDLLNDTITLVSRGDGPTGVKVNLDVYTFDLSNDGRHVSFDTFAENLTAPDGLDTDTFVRDLDADTTVLAGVAPNGDEADNNTYESSISGDGRFVSFSGSGTINLSDEDPDTWHDIFVRDVAAGTTTLVSRAAGPAGAVQNFHAGISVLSGDGSWVAFHSDADNLHPEDTNALVVTDVYMRDIFDPPPSDTTPPAAPTITSGPPSKTKSKSATFTFVGSEPGGTFQCRLDTASFTACASPKTYKVKPGRHTFGVRQIDAALNVGPEATRTWKRKKPA